jgi:hypothetical protein
MRAIFLATLLGVTPLLLAPRLCHAAPASEAETLFEQGRQLLKEGRLEAACAAFDRSFTLDASPGTLLNLGDCQERTGHRAQAYASFQAAAQLAKQQAWVDMAQEAERREQQLAATFPRLTVTVPSGVAGLVVELDGVALAEGDFGQPRALPPGRVRLRAEAPGHQAWTSELVLERDQTIAIPELQLSVAAEPLPVASPGPASVAQRRPEERPPAPSRPAWAPWAVVATGGAALGASVVTGVMAQNKHRELAAACPVPSNCSEALRGTRDSGKRLAFTTDVLWISGAAAVGGGLAWYFLTRQRPSEPGLHVAPTLAANAASATLSGSF